MTSNSNFYSSDNQIQAGWAKFDEIGQSYKGTFVEKFRKDGQNGLPDQIVYVLANASAEKLECDDEGNVKKLISSDPIDGDLNVGIKESNSYINSRLKNCLPGDIIAFAFTREIPAKTKGYSNAKSIQVFKSGVDEEYLASQGGNTEEDGNDMPF